MTGPVRRVPHTLLPGSQTRCVHKGSHFTGCDRMECAGGTGGAAGLPASPRAPRGSPPDRAAAITLPRRTMSTSALSGL